MKIRPISTVISIIVLVLFIATILITKDAKTQNKESQQMFQQEEMNKKVVQRLVQALNEKKESVFDEFIAEKYVQHRNGITESITGPDVIKGTLEWDSETFKENNYTIEDIISKGDKVVIRMILQGITKRDSKVTNHSILIMRFEKGKIVEGWVANDRLSLNRQLAPQKESPQSFQQEEMMKKVMGKMAESIMEAMLTTMAKSQTTELLSTFSKNYYDALRDKGFSKDDALEIVISVGMPSIPAMK